jgi:hypothetical protein
MSEQDRAGVTVVMAMEMPRNSPIPKPDRDDRDDILEALQVTLDAFALALDLAVGTRGGQAMQDRSYDPKVGDLVTVTFTLDRLPERTLGWLREIEVGTGVASMNRYLIDPVTAHPPVWWENVKVRSVPTGDVFGSLISDPDKVFQRQDKEAKR